MYTLADLEAARKELQKWSEAFANYSGNNPNKHQSKIKMARREVRFIEKHLKNSGVLPLTEQETLEQKLDQAFPNAQSKEIVSFEGKCYQLRFFPLEHSRSRKSVMEWGRSWIQINNNCRDEG